MLSFSEGRPIAKITGGEYNGKILCILDPSNNKKEEKKEKKCCSKCSSKCNSKHKCCKKCLGAGGCLTCGGNNIKMGMFDLKLKNGKLSPLPNIDTRDVLYVAGPSGSGKSTYTADYIKQVQKIYPKMPIFIFSRVNEDKVLDELKPIRIELDEEVVADPIRPGELNNSVCVFDDIDTISDKKINEAVRKLRDDLLETGRHENVYMVCTSHQLMNYKHTRTLINEATCVTFFPQSGSSYHIQRFLKEYCGLSKLQIEKILHLPSRWVTIGKLYPMYILYEKGCYMLNSI